MPKYFGKLRLSTVRDYLDRRFDGHIFLIYNSENEKFLFVPKNMNHSDFIPVFLNVKLEEIISKNVDISYFIPVTLAIKDNKYREVIIGISSLEMNYGIVHSKENLEKARNATMVLLERGPLEIDKNLEVIVSKKH